MIDFGTAAHPHIGNLQLHQLSAAGTVAASRVYASAGASLPAGFVSGDLAAIRSTTSGCAWLGGDGVANVCRDTSGRTTFGGGVQFPVAFTGVPRGDGAGEITIIASTSTTYTFTGIYRTAPLCTVTPTSDPSAVGAYWATTTTTTLTVRTHTPGTITFTFHCDART